MTDQNRQDRLVRILDAALDLPRERRSAFVSEACEGDQELSEEIGDLLFRTGEVSEFLQAAQKVVDQLPGRSATPGAENESSVSDPPAGDTGQTGPDDVPAMAVPERIGPYRILEVLGEGGMGMVYLAEQREPVRRQVALKLIKLGMDTREVVARFEAELQALALMDHPNIAKVHDAGSTDDGRPYFVMERVRGLPLSEYCDRHRLTVRERLNLFTQVCQGIDHAHRRGIIHRDLKPSNVLVSMPDQTPVAKIIDFGVARATNQRLTEKTIYTEIGRAVGTPAYMSPEQAELSGEDVDHRTDVYSLGVLLYEVLVGEPPLDPELLAKAAFDEILRRIRDEDPPAPSTRWTRMNLERTTRLAARRNSSPEKLAGMLRGDLDWITMKAVEKERERRYGTVTELSADIARHIQGYPVEAGPPSILYKLKKYASKNRTPVMAAGAVFLVLVASFVVSLFFVQAALKSEKLALDNEKLANQRASENVALADLERLRNYKTEAEEGVWPWPPEQRPGVKTWLEKADSLLERLDGYRVELSRLRQSAESRKSGPGVRDAHEYTFSDAETAQRHEMVETLVRRLQSFGNPDPESGTVAAMRRRLENCPSAEASAKSWEKAIASIQNRDECPLYNGLEIEVAADLIPLGRDPRSRLWEFVHPRTGTVPTRDDSGALRIERDSAVVFVLLPGGGPFKMGTPRPKEGNDRPSNRGRFRVRRSIEPEHEVSLSPFLIAKHEVTQAQWKTMMDGCNLSEFEGDALPVTWVSWDDCTSFCQSIGASLPSAAQWEYACRAGTSTRFSFGDTITLEDVNFNGDDPHRGPDTLEEAGRWETVAVGSLPANSFGLHEMHGNVAEWCQDVFDPGFYSTEAASGLDPLCAPEHLNKRAGREVRGGSYISPAHLCRSARRGTFPYKQPNFEIGFRPVRLSP